MKVKLDEKSPNVGVSIVHKQILEIKKKIQLSEGQRKAIFEECDSEHRTNIEKIQKLKDEIQELLSNLKRIKQPTYGKRLESIIGGYGDKKFDEIHEILRLQIIDRVKLLNLLNFQQKRNQKLLANLAEEYQKLLSSQTINIDAPLKSKISDLQNNIHAIEIQSLEANHINQRYNEIRRTLLDDSSKFESNIVTMMERIEQQIKQLNKLFQIVEEATKLRTIVRNSLLKEEKHALHSANHREKQTIEGQRLVNSGKQQLEIMEKFIFQTQKINMKTTNPEEINGVVDDIDEEFIETVPQPQEDGLFKIFEELKYVTGATSIEEIHQRFIIQHDTNLRLLQLRMKLELNKKQLERQLDYLTKQLEQFKYGEMNDKNSITNQMETIQEQLDNQRMSFENYRRNIDKHQQSLENLSIIVRDLHFFVNPYFQITENTKISEILYSIKDTIIVAIEKTDFLKLDTKLRNLDMNTEPTLPTPYNSLIRKTPLPQQTSSPIPPPTRQGSAEDDEVPSRSYLKRQAQLVIDAKSRKKKHN